MPRALTEQERARVLHRLHTLGRDRFIRFGLARTTIAGLAEDAGIGKGSFYQFYPSKEALFMAISQREEEQFRRALLDDVACMSSGREAVMALLHAPSQRLDGHPFLRMLLDPQTISALVLRLPHEELERNQAADRAFFVNLARQWQHKGWLRDELDPVEVFEVLSGVFLIAVQSDLLDGDAARRAIHAIAEAMCDRWV